MNRRAFLKGAAVVSVGIVVARPPETSEPDADACTNIYTLNVQMPPYTARELREMERWKRRLQEINDLV